MAAAFSNVKVLPETSDEANTRAKLQMIKAFETAILQLPSFGVVTGQYPYVSFDFLRWREVVVFANQ